MSEPLSALDAEWSALRNGLSKAYVASDIDDALATARPRIEAAAIAASERPPVDPPTGGTDATPSAVQTEHHEADSGQDAADRRGADPAPDPRRDPVARPPVDAAIATDWARMLDDGIAGHVLASVIRATVARLSDTGDTPDGAS